MRALRRAKREVGAAHRARRHRRRLGRRRGDRGADPLCRRRGRRGARLSPAPERAQPGGLRSIPTRPIRRRAAGMVVLALGKHGARELNYSSDIDLIVLYDAAAASIPEGTEPAPLFVRITKALARLLQERTARRLRAAGRSAAQARPGLDAGRALDRSAPTPITRRSARTGSARRMIKARPAAGDLDAWPALSRRARAVHLAQVFRLRARSPTSTR